MHAHTTWRLPRNEPESDDALLRIEGVRPGVRPGVLPGVDDNWLVNVARMRALKPPRLPKPVRMTPSRNSRSSST